MKRKYQAAVFLWLVLMLPVCQPAGARQPAPYAVINGVLPAEQEGDTITLTLWEHYFMNESPNRFFSPAVYQAVVRNGRFGFRVPLIKAVQYCILAGKKQLVPGGKLFQKPEDNLLFYLSPRFLEEGDSLTIVQEKEQWRFSGKGAEKFEFLEEVSYRMKHDPAAPHHSFAMMGTPEAMDRLITGKEKVLRYKLGLLQKYQSRLSPLAYTILTADLAGAELGSCYRMSSYFERPQRDTLLALYREKISRMEKNVLPGASPDVALSAAFPEMLLEKMIAEDRYRYYLGGPSGKDSVSFFSGANMLEHLKRERKSLLRDKLLYLYVYRSLDARGQGRLGYLLQHAPAYIHDPALRSLVDDFAARFSKGQPVQDFAMEDTLGNLVRLSDFRGKVVFIDIWFTGCGACKLVSKAMPEVEESFKGDTNIVFLNISIDRNKALWKNSIQRDTIRDLSLGYQWPGAHYSGNRTKYLYTAGRGEDDPFISQYVTHGYPTLLLIGRSGRFYSFRPARPDALGGKEKLAGMIREALSDHFQ